MTIEELEKYGMERMSDEEIEAYLETHNLGVLGLPSEDAPYQIPMSYGYDGGVRLYFVFVAGADSQKLDLLAETSAASFLVYTAETAFMWRSVALTGTVHSLPTEKRDELRESQLPTWRPELFETASEIEQTQLVEFRIKEWSGVKHLGLPPALLDDITGIE